MDTTNGDTGISQADICESTMYKVVGMRKRYSKVCIEYGNKISSKKMDLLRSEIENMHIIRPNLKVLITSADAVSFEAECDQLKVEDQKHACRLTRISNKLKNLQEISSQLRRDKINAMLKLPVSSENFLAMAKSEKEKEIS